MGLSRPLLPLMIGDDPPIEESDDEGMKQALRPDGRSRRPWPVEPRWKLWKHRELRRSTKEAREAAAKRKAAGGTIRVRGGVSRFDPAEDPEPIRAPTTGSEPL